MSIFNKIEIQNKPSTLNSTSTPLLSGGVWEGTGEEAERAGVVIAVKSDQPGTLYVDFSPDNANWDSTLTYDVASNNNDVHKLTVTRKFCRVRYTNLGGDQTFFRLQTMFGEFGPLTSTMNSQIQQDADALVTRGILTGQTENGRFKNVPVTAEGHLEVEVHGPRLPFGSLHTENLTPIIQKDAVYGLIGGEITYSSALSGSVTNGDGLYTCSTGTAVGGQAVLQSRKRLRYRPGQGILGRYTALFTNVEGISGSYAIAGFGQAEDGFYFGYKDGVFGILHTYRGVREKQILTITTGSSTAENVTVTLNNTAFSVPVTNSANIQRTVWEISSYDGYEGWSAHAQGATVVFLANDAGDKTGTFSLSATTAAGNFSQSEAGALATENFIPQTTWNVDTFDGSGDVNNPSGVLLDQTKGNVYQIGIQYLGFGAIIFSIEISYEGNNPVWENCHILNYPNNNTLPSLGNPSFPFTLAAYSAGSTTDLSVSTACFAGFIEGKKVLRGPRFTYKRTLSSVGTTATDVYHALFTVKNSPVYGGRTNQSVINVLGLGTAYNHTRAGEFVLIKNGSLQGNPNFASYSSGSCSLYDTSATTVTVTANEQVLFTVPYGDVGQGGISFKDDEIIELQPGEYLTLACKISQTTATDVNGTINTREDQ